MMSARWVCSSFRNSLELNETPIRALQGAYDRNQIDIHDTNAVVNICRPRYDNLKILLNKLS